MFKSLPKRDKYLVVSITAILTLLVMSFYLALDDHNPLPDAVIYVVGGFFGTEIYHCARIKINDSNKELRKGEQ